VGTGTGNHSATIQGGVDLASAGDTVYVWPGTYTGQVMITESINLVGHDRNTVVLENAFTGNVLWVTANWVNVTSITVERSGVGNYGIYLNNADNCKIQNSRITSNGFGIYLNFADYCTISNNTVYSNADTGIYLTDSTNNIIEKNQVSGNSGSGIIVNWANGNTLRGNNASSNNQLGIYLFSSNGNNVYNNNIRSNGNSQQANDNTGGNTWHQPLPVGGNHWSDWTTPDANADGIVDNPRSIGGGGGAQDGYPYTLPDGWNLEKGSGTEEDPFMIYDVWQLQAIKNNLVAHYALGNNINAAITSTWNGGLGFYPIGFEGSTFTGTLDGRGHTISSLKIVRTATGYSVGLFGNMDIGSAVFNLGLVSADIRGGTLGVGALAGYCAGTVFKCHSTGAIVGTSFSYSGGLIGWMASGGSVTNSYSWASVTGGTDVGGFVGRAWAYVARCYSTGSVGTGTSKGGFAGYNYDTIVNCFWDTTTSGTFVGIGGGTLAGVTGRTTVQMKTQSTFTAAGWDFSKIWWMDEGVTYPNIREPLLPNGAGTAQSPYLIFDAVQLQVIQNDLGSHYKLACDIDASETSSWNSGQGFAPIGYDVTPFTGKFNGSGHAITGLYINRQSFDYAGLFGRLGPTGIIENVHMIDVNVNGKSYTGGLVGCNDQGLVANSSSSGTVKGFVEVGGLVGLNFGTISKSYSSADVTATTQEVGGLAGYLSWNSYVIESYATGNVVGTDYVGGLVGWNFQGNIHNSYATGGVSGGNYVGGLTGSCEGATIMYSYSSGSVSGIGVDTGGLLGYVTSSTVMGCFWDTQTSGRATSAGGTGQTTTQMMNSATFNGAGWDFTNKWWMVSGDTRPFLRAEWGTRIRNSHQLQMMYVYPGVSYELACDIDLSEITQPAQMWGSSTASGLGFLPVGISGNKFIGTLEGNGHSVSNLFINRPSLDYIGLIGFTDTASKVYNVSMENVNVTGHTSVGGLVGYNFGLIEGSHVSGKVLGTWYNAGGITGYNTASGIISKCSNSANITVASNNAGGISGYCMGSISESFSTGTVRASLYAGGLGGYMNGISVTDCYATGNVTATTHTAGGLVAYSVSGTTITNSYSTGFLTSPSTKGGLVGSNPGGTITSSFWDTETSGLATSSGGIGKTTAQMKTQSTFTSVGWDFVDTWHMSEGETYPLFIWQPLPPASAIHYGMNSVIWDDIGERFWLCGETGGDSTVYYIDPQQSTTVSVPVAGAPLTSLTSIASDNLGNILVGGTSGDTLHYYDGSNWQVIYSENPVGFEALAMDFNPNDGRFYLAGYEDSPAVMAFYYTNQVPLIGGGTFYRYDAPGLTADVLMRSIAWNDLHDYGIAVGDGGQAVKVWPYSYLGDGTMHYQNITSPVTNEFYDISWDTDGWNEAAIVGRNQTFGNYWRYYDSNPRLIQGRTDPTSGTLYRTCAFKPQSSAKWVLIPHSGGGVKINVEEKYEGGEIVINMLNPNIFRTEMRLASDLSETNLLNMQVDAGTNYTFFIEGNYTGGWDNVDITITAWQDRNKLGDQSAPGGWNAMNRTRQFNLTYRPSTDIGTMHYPLPENGVSEFYIVSARSVPGQGPDGSRHHVYITVHFGTQTRAATGAMNPAVDVRDMNQALNDLNTWDVSVRLFDRNIPSSDDVIHDEFGIKEYAWISATGTPSGSAPPGATNVHLSSSFINYSTNTNHSITVSIPNLHRDGNPVNPMIAADRLAIQNTMASAAYSDISTQQAFPGPNTPLFIWGKSAGPVLIQAPYNGTRSAGPFTDYSEGYGVYTMIDWWMTEVPVSTQEGMYMGTITITLGY
jgi:parallel beta-helix repeat protein